MNRKIFNPMIKSVFKACTYVSVRDEQSADYLRGLGLQWNQIHVVPDPVMGLPLPETKVERSADAVSANATTQANRVEPSTGGHTKLPVIGVSVRFGSQTGRNLRLLPPD